MCRSPVEGWQGCGVTPMTCQPFVNLSNPCANNPGVVGVDPSAFRSGQVRFSGPDLENRDRDRSEIFHLSLRPQPDCGSPRDHSSYILCTGP